MNDLKDNDVEIKRLSTIHLNKHYSVVPAEYAVPVWRLHRVYFFFIFTSFVSDCRPPTGLVIGRVGQSRVYTIRWTAPKGVRVDQYGIEYKKTSEHLPSYVFIGSAATKYKLDLTGTEPGDRYTVRVKAICGGHAGEYSRSVTFSDGRRSEFARISFHKCPIFLSRTLANLFVISKYGSK